MTPQLNAFGSVKKWLFEHYSNDAGKMLLHTGTAGWILSAAGQIFGIVNNDKVSKKEKKFLIPQEIVDAGINILSFYIVTNKIQNVTKALASKGKVITPAIRVFCEKHGIQFTKGADGKSPNIGKSILDKVKNYESVVKVNGDSKLNLGVDEKKIAELNTEIKELNNFYDKTYSPFESGLKVAGGIFGAVLSGNIITPLLRNPIAAAKQKSSLSREKMEHDAAMYRDGKTLPVNKNVGLDAYKSNVYPSGSMRI